MKASIKRGFIVPLALVTLGAGFLIQFSPRDSVVKAVVPDLERTISWSLPGWIIRDEPLGATEALRSESTKVLRLDAFCYKSYSRDRTMFSIYVGYWNKSEERLPIAVSHLPERCWVSGGMRCLEFKNRTIFGRPGSLPPAEWRSFDDPSGQKLEVAYWLWFGGEPFRFGDGLQWRGDDREGFNRANLLEHGIWLVDHALKGSREQYFVRCTSNIPLEELLKLPGVESLISRAAALGKAP